MTNSRLVKRNDDNSAQAPRSSTPSRCVKKRTCPHGHPWADHTLRAAFAQSRRAVTRITLRSTTRREGHGPDRRPRTAILPIIAAHPIEPGRLRWRCRGVRAPKCEPRLTVGHPDLPATEVIGEAADVVEERTDRGT
jgi:hypothetical protein